VYCNGLAKTCNHSLYFRLDFDESNAQSPNLYLFAHLLVIINESASNTESSAATIAYLEYCERTCRRYYSPWTKTRKLINLSLLSAHDDDGADEIERHRIAGRKDTFVLDLFTSLIVTLHTGMRHRRVGKGAP
jgi:hypothetical protein